MTVAKQERIDLRTQLAHYKKEAEDLYTHTRQLEMQVFELQNASNLNHELVQHASDALAALDNELSVKVINKSFVTFFSRMFAIQITAGMNINVAISGFPELKNRINIACQCALLGNESSVIIESSSDNNDVYYYYELVVWYFYNQYIKKSELIFRVRDLTEYKLEQKRQRQLQTDITLACRVSEMGEMTSAFAHEINQPLTAIIAYSRSCLFIIKDKLDYKMICNKLLAPLENIARQAEHAGEIIFNLKKFMREGKFNVEEADINLLLQEVLFILDHELLDYKLNIILNLEEGLPVVMVNKIHIMQIVFNLLRNSIEALKSVEEANPEVTINTCLINNHIVVHVIDNGPGIPSEYKNKILHTYFTTKPKGTGIGLGVCRSLVEAHGGELRVETHKKNGAWFSFTLPVVLDKP